MKAIHFKMFLVASLIFMEAKSTRTARSVSINDVRQVKTELGKIVKWKDMPAEVAEWLAILNKHMYILACLPTVERENCYQTPDYCSVDPVKIDGKPLNVRFAICKDPVSIVLHYRVPMPTWAKLILEVDFQPVRIVFDTKRKHGVTLVNSESTVKVQIRGIRLGVLKVTLKIYAMLRWDCTKPTNLHQRLFYNTQYDDGIPGHDFNKVFYKFRVRVEYKVKKIPCFCYRCRRCEDLVNKQGHIYSGPESCNREVSGPLSEISKGNPRRGSKIYKRHFARYSHCQVKKDKSSIAWLVYKYNFLKNPKRFEPGTKLIFAGIKKARERADLMAFIKDKTFICSSQTYDPRHI